MTKGIYLNLTLNKQLPSIVSGFIRECLIDPKRGIRYTLDHPEISEAWVCLFSRHRRFPAWQRKSFTEDEFGLHHLQLAAASDLLECSILHSFLEWLLPHARSRGLVAMHLTAPYTDYPKLIRIEHGHVVTHYHRGYVTELEHVTPDYDLMLKINKLPILHR